MSTGNEIQAINDERLRALVLAFVETVEHADAARESMGKGGQQVGCYSGDFVYAQPSVAGRLRWWAREMRSALEGR